MSPDDAAPVISAKARRAGKAAGWRNRIVGHAEVDPATLIPNPENWRQHPPEQVAALEGVLDQLGILQGVIVNKRTGHLVDGHARAELAKQRGQPKIQVTYVDLTLKEERLALATLDPLSRMAATDQAKLQVLLGQIHNKDAGVRALLDQLAKEAKGIIEAEAPGRADPDAIPTRAPKRCRPGEVWDLGPHVLVIGDATKPETLAAFGGAPAELLLVDPPYNVAIDGLAGTIANDDLKAPQFNTFLTGLFRTAAAALRPGAAFYVFHSDTERVAFETALQAAQLGVHQCLIWAKHQATFTRHDYNWRHEPILYGWKIGGPHYFAFDFTETTVLEQTRDLAKLKAPELRALVEQLLQREATTTVICEPKPARSPDHPTMKPVALLTRLIANSTRRGERVLDVCGGSGSTLIAAATLERVAHLVELDPRFGDVILKRWEDWSGTKAVRRVSRAQR